LFPNKSFLSRSKNRKKRHTKRIDIRVRIHQE
jgi:hypothetical protein